VAEGAGAPAVAAPTQGQSLPTLIGDLECWQGGQRIFFLDRVTSFPDDIGGPLMQLANRWTARIISFPSAAVLCLFQRHGR